MHPAPTRWNAPSPRRLPLGQQNAPLLDDAVLAKPAIANYEAEIRSSSGDAEFRLNQEQRYALTLANAW